MKKLPIPPNTRVVEMRVVEMHMVLTKGRLSAGDVCSLCPYVKDARCRGPANCPGDDDHVLALDAYLPELLVAKMALETGEKV